MKNRIYKVTEEGLAAYMRFNKMAETAVVGETADGFILQNGKKVQPLSKNIVESWMLDHGFVPGMGYDALSEQDKAVFEGNRSRNTTQQKEQSMKKYDERDDVMQGYYDQLPSTRAARGATAASGNLVDNADGPIEGVHYRGRKSYPKGTGTNQ